MATPPQAMGVATAPTAPNKNSPHLHSVASSLRSCLDGMLPDTLRNDSVAFQQHLMQQKNRLQTEKNSWRFGLNYLFETLKQHKDWYGRNQQFVQLRKDVKRFETHVATVRTILAESVSKLDLEAGLRGAELEGRVGAYKVMFEVTKIVSNLSRPLVKLQILKPNESSLSVYCDTFVLDIVLSGGEGAVESASLTTVEKDQSSQFPDRDEDLLASLKLLANGDSANFTEKLNRLINRAELAVKFPSMSFEQLELELFTKAAEACSQQKYWTVKRAVEGVRIMFNDPFACIPVIEPPHVDGANGPADDRDDLTKTTSPAQTDVLSPLANGEWAGSISFIEWRGEVALHVVGENPLVMAGQQARKLALVAMHKHTDVAATAPKDVHEDEKLFNEFLTNASVETLTNVFQVCGRSLFFHALLLSAFCSRSNTFGQRIPADNDDAVNARIRVDVAAPERITMNTGELLGAGKQVLIEVNTKPDCSLDLRVKYLDDASATSAPPLENAATLQKLAEACHSIPLLTYYALKRTVQGQNGPSAVGTTGANGEDCNGIAALDGDLSVSMKMEGEGMLLDDMDMF
uniref:Mediator of RNA polymerase II transcription subunit 1 n=1 Tax=Phytophthora ramorum TaxID=164328 RepID=H3HDZ2_PHYRM